MAAGIQTKIEESELRAAAIQNAGQRLPAPSPAPGSVKAKSHGIEKDASGGAKRRCVSTACIACRKRKSKCDGNTPSCAACSSVYNTECIYDPHSDHRRKGVYKKDIDNLKTRNSTLQTLIQAILNYPESEVADLVREIRGCESLDDVAESIIAKTNALDEDDGTDEGVAYGNVTPSGVPQFEKELSGKMGKLRLDNGSVSIVGGTSNLIFLGASQDGVENDYGLDEMDEYTTDREPIASWTQVTSDPRLVLHLTNLYFTWHYTFFTTLSKTLFWRDFKQGKPSRDSKLKTEYCTPLLVNAILALGCHFTSWPAARTDPEDSATAGDHFFKEAKRLILENDEHEKPRLATVQALALMSVREAGCGREARGWVYSGMSFRMAYDLGLNIGDRADDMEESEADARRITIWGCFLFDKCWSNYLGRQPQLPLSSISVPKFDVFPMEDADIWRPQMDSGIGQAHAQPSRTRAVALQISLLCEISSDLLLYFYHPHHLEKPLSKQSELKKLSELHTRLEAWRKDLPKELEPKEGQLPTVLVMHMFFHLLYIHLFRPFLKYKPMSSPLPSHVSPRKFLIQAATAISKLLRLYRRTYGLRQICNIVVYIAHSACTVHLLNLPDKFANRDIVHGLNHLEEISESWLCARRTLGILSQVSRRWAIDLPEAAQKTFERAEAKFGPLKSHEHDLSPRPEILMPPPPTPMQPLPSPEANTIPASSSNAPASSSGSYMATTMLPAASPPSSPVSRTLNGSISLPPPTPLVANRGNHSSRQNRILSHPQQPHQQQQEQQKEKQGQHMWNRDQANTGLTSPAVLFNGIDGLIKDQEWWLQDSNQIFANWNGYDHADTTPAEPVAATYPSRNRGSSRTMSSGNGISHQNYVNLMDNKPSTATGPARPGNGVGNGSGNGNNGNDNGIDETDMEINIDIYGNDDNDNGIYSGYSVDMDTGMGMGMGTAMGLGAGGGQIVGDLNRSDLV